MAKTDFKTIGKKLFALALPMMFTQFIAVSSGFLAIIFLSHLGSEVLAASALIFSIRISILVIGSSILFSLSILIGHAYGEKEYLRIGNFVQQGWLIALCVSLPILIFYWHIYPILIYFHQLKGLAVISQEFFHANIWNVIPFLLSVCNQQLLYGTRKQQVDLLANIGGVLILLITAYPLMFGKWGFPQLGTAGLGYALDLQAWFYFLFTSAVICFTPFYQRFDLFTLRIQKSYQDFIRLLQVGWPICVQIGGEMLSFSAISILIGWLGAQSLAAFQIVLQYFILTLVPLFALAQANGVLISQALGEKNLYQIKKIAHISLVFALVVTICIGLIFIIFPEQLAQLYLKATHGNQQTILDLINILFAIYAVSLIFDGLRNILTGALRGLFDTQFPMYIGLFSLWLIGLPLGYVLAFNLSLGVAGMIIGFTLGIGVGMILLWVRWRNKMAQLSHMTLLPP